MWIFFGLGALIFGLLNLYNYFKKKDWAFFRYLSLSFTCLTLTAFYWDASQRVISEDWPSLMDIMPTMGRALWFCTIGSLILNGLTLFKNTK